MLVAIVSQDSFLLVLMGYRTIAVRYVGQWGLAQMCLCENKHQGGLSQLLGTALAANLPERVLHDMGYPNDSIAISCDVGPLSPSGCQLSIRAVESTALHLGSLALSLSLSL